MCYEDTNTIRAHRNNLIYELLVCRFERQCEEKIVQGIEFDMNKKFQQGF